MHKNVTSLAKQGLEWFGLLIIHFKLDSKRHLKQPESVDPQSTDTQVKLNVLYATGLMDMTAARQTHAVSSLTKKGFNPL